MSAEDLLGVMTWGLEVEDVVFCEQLIAISTEQIKNRERILMWVDL